MSDLSPRLGLPYLLPAQAQKHVTHNEALRRLDAIVHLAVIDRDRAVPPGTPAEGDRHIVAPGATGDWAGQEGRIALRDQAAWHFVIPGAGWRAEVLAEGHAVVFDGSAWQAVRIDLQNLPPVGVGTVADATNALSVAAPATLLTHAGAGHQLKINKAGAAETASLLFQSGWSGRAEMGLAGDENFSIKVSVDGAAWIAAAVFSAATGAAALAAGTTIGGQAAYHRGNLLGTVTQTAGVPTGAAVERGSTASGEYVRFADGTQICTGTVTLTYSSTSTAQADWTYPAAFAAAPRLSGMIDASSVSMAPSLDQLQSVMRSNSGANTTVGRLSVRRQSGGTNFAAGNTVPVLATAIGRWF